MSGIANALGPLKLLRQAGTPGRPDSQPSERPGAPDVQHASTLGRPDARTPERPALPLQGTAKRSHPDFGKRTIYVRDRTHRDALRKYEDAGGKEFSELVETLLQEYVGRSR